MKSFLVAAIFSLQVAAGLGQIALNPSNLLDLGSTTLNSTVNVINDDIIKSFANFKVQNYC